MLTRHSFMYVSVCLLAFNSVSFYWCLESPNVHINKFIGILVWWPKQQTIEWFHCCYCVLRYFSVGSGLHAHTARIAIEIDRFVLMLPRCDSVLLHWNHIYNYYIAIVYGNWRFYSFGISTMCATTAAINSNLMECINVLKKNFTITNTAAARRAHFRHERDEQIKWRKINFKFATDIYSKRNEIRMATHVFVNL